MTRGEAIAPARHRRRTAIVLALLAPLAPAAAAQNGEDARHDPHAHHRAAARRGAETTAVTGLSLPDTPVVDQDGRELRFYSDLVADRTVAMNFIFTTCTTICPPMGANFARLRRLLDGGDGRGVHLISVSIDPETDTPQRLQAWREKLGGGEGWTLVTGDKTQVDRLLKALKVFTPDAEDHAPIALVGNDATHQWRRVYGLAPPATLAQVIDDVSGGEAAPAGSKGGQP